MDLISNKGLLTIHEKFETATRFYCVNQSLFMYSKNISFTHKLFYINKAIEN